MNIRLKIAAGAMLLGGLFPTAVAGEPAPKPSPTGQAGQTSPTGPTSPTEPPPAPAAPAAPEQTAAKHNPFVPSAAMRERARRAGAYGDGGAALGGDGGVPVLVGIIVRDKAVLACFRSGGATTLVEPGDAFLCGGVRFVFVKYAAEAVTLQDQDGAKVEMRLGSREKR